jgi:hypothetical protein
MPLFNNAVVAALFKTTGTPTTPNSSTGNDNKRICNRVKTDKYELVKQDVPTSMTVLHLVLPTTEDKYYMDMPNATTVQALETN